MTQRFHGLDGLRGVCALTVVLFHYGDLISPIHIADHGYLAVDLFFVLSGFVIALNYEHRLALGLGLTEFLKIRGRRLLPIYWLGTTACIFSAFISGITGPSPFWVMSITTFFLIPIGTPIFPLNGLAWSLFSEWVVNAIYAIIGYKIRTISVAKFCILCFAIALFVRLRGYAIPYGEGAQTWFGYLRALTGFSAGVVLCRCKNLIISRLPSIAPEILYATWIVAAALPIAAPSPIYDAIVVIFCAPLLIALLIRSEARAPKWCAMAGKLSYPLYASHMAILFIARQLIPHPNPLAATAAVAAALVLAWSIAWANDRIQDWMRRPATTQANPAQ